MYMCSSFALRLSHEKLAQLRICFGFVVKSVVLKHAAVAKPCGSQSVGHSVHVLQVGNCDLHIDDILGAKSRNCGRPDVIDSNRTVADQVADVPRDLPEV